MAKWISIRKMTNLCSSTIGIFLSQKNTGICFLVVFVRDLSYYLFIKPIYQQHICNSQDAKQQRPSLINSATAARLMKPARALHVTSMLGFYSCKYCLVKYK